MDKLTDYIGWMGALDFACCPFREADALILCVLSYFDLRPVFDAFGPTPRVRDCLPMIEAGEAKLRITGGDLGNSEVFEAAVRSERFGNLTMSDCEDILKPDAALQFAAVTFHDGDRFSLIAFRGTDATLAGWKEDCMISFTRTEAQEMAAAYAERRILAAADDGRDWYVAGHSKGGNQALFASCMLSDAAWERVTRVYVLDGPGFCPEVIDLSVMDRIDGKTTRIVPEFEVIGKLFEPKITDTRIVKSSQEGVVQHSLPSWLVDHGALAETDAFDPISVWIGDTMGVWIEDIPQDDRPMFVDELFDALGANGMTSLDDLGIEDISAALIELGKSSDVTKRAMDALPRAIVYGNAAEDKPDEPKKTGFLSRMTYSPLTRCLLFVVLGICVILFPEKVVQAAAVVLALAAALIYVGLTVRKLIRQRWAMTGMRNQIVLSLVLIALFAAAAFNEHVTFILGNTLFGALCFAEACLSWEKAAREKGGRFRRVMYITECLLTFLCGVSFLLIPRVTVGFYGVYVGILLIADGIARLIRFLTSGTDRKHGQTAGR